MEKKSHISGRATLLITFYLMPIALVFWFIFKFGINVPVGDDWALLRFFEKIANHTVTFGDLYAQHNEHRILFPRILFTLLAFCSNWNLKVEMYFSLFLATIEVFLIYRISKLSDNKKNIHFFNILSGFILFSLIQYENWLWGFQLAWFLINTCILTSVYILSAPSELSKEMKVFLSGLCCFIASFSAAHGLLSWIALIPLVATIGDTPKVRNKFLLIWMALFIGCSLLYAIGYQKPEHHPDILFSLKHPLVALKYFLTLIGNPLYIKIIPTAVIGLLILSIFILLHICILKNKKLNILYNCLPWISIGCFCILFSLMTTIGRVGFGVEQASAPRYTSVNLLLIISCLQILRLILLTKWYKKQRNLYTNVLVYALIGFLLIQPLAANLAILKTQKSETYNGLLSFRDTGNACLEILHYFDKNSSANFTPTQSGSNDNCLQILYPLPTEIKAWSNILAELQFRDFYDGLLFNNKPTKTYGEIQSVSHINKADFRIDGRVILSANNSIPRVVLFSYGDKKVFFEKTLLKSDIRDNTVSWSKIIKKSDIPKEENLIKAWVYDRTNKQFVKLNGVASVGTG